MPELPIVHRHPVGRRVAPLMWIVAVVVLVTAGLRSWWVTVAYLALLAAVSAARWFEHLTVDERGLTVRTMRTVRIPWNDVRSIARSAGGRSGGIDIVTTSGAVHSPFPYSGKNEPATDEQLAAIEAARPSSPAVEPPSDATE